MTSVRVRVADRQPPAPGIQLLAYATIELDAAFVVSHLRVLINERGHRVVEWPSRPNGVGRYVDVAYPRCPALREEMRGAVLAATDRALGGEG